jgi:cell division protein FtsX
MKCPTHRATINSMIAISTAEPVPKIVPVTPTNPADTGDVSQLADLTKSQRVKKLRGNTQRADRLIGVWQTAAFRRLAARASRGSVSKWI